MRSGRWRIPLRLRLAGVLRLLTVEERLALQATSRPEQILDAYPGIERALLRGYAEADPALFPVASQRYTDLVKAVYRLHLLALQLATPGPPTIYEEDSLWHKLVLCESRELLRCVPMPDAALVLHASDPGVLVERRSARGKRHDQRAAGAIPAGEREARIRRQVHAWQRLVEDYAAIGVPVRSIDCQEPVTEQAPKFGRWFDACLPGGGIGGV